MASAVAEPTTATAVTLSTPTWFFQVNRDESKALLLGQPDGTYLVRRSSQPGCYSIDVVVGGLYLPILVLPDTAHGGVICSKVPCLDISEQKYPDLDALIKAQSAHLQVVCPRAGVSPKVTRGVKGTKVEGEEEDTILMLSGDAASGGGAATAAHTFDAHGARARVTRAAKPTATAAGAGGGGAGAAKREGEEEDMMLMAGGTFDPHAARRH